MKSECIVHIGMNKTGSSVIQHQVASSLDDKNFTYTKLRSPNHSASIASLFMENPSQYHTHQKLGRTEKEIEEFNNKTLEMLEKSFNTSSTSYHIISGEDISKLTALELQKFKVYLENFFSTITIVAYYRLPHSFIQSAFQQRVKGGLNHFHIKNIYPHYKQLFEKFDNVFSVENVHLWQYDRALFPNQNIVEDFSHRLKFNMKNIKSIEENESLSLEAIALLYCYHKFGRGYGQGKNVIKENELLIASLNTLGDTRFTFSSILTSSISSLYLEDIQWLKNRVGKSLEEMIVNRPESIKNEMELINIAQSLESILNTLCLDYNLNLEAFTNTPQEIANKIDLLRQVLVKKYFSELNKV